MASLKQYKLAEKAQAEQQRVVHELNALVNSIERCEKTIADLKAELETVTTKYSGPRTTRDEIAYLEALLQCAHKKLNWEKQIASLRKRTPATLEAMARLVNDPQSPPSEEMRAAMLHALQAVQAAMERLEQVKMQ